MISRTVMYQQYKQQCQSRYAALSVDMQPTFMLHFPKTNMIRGDRGRRESGGGEEGGGVPQVIIEAVIDQDIEVRSRGALKLKTGRGGLHEILTLTSEILLGNTTQTQVCTQSL